MYVVFIYLLTASRSIHILAWDPRATAHRVHTLRQH